jgi:hypothetical protein
MNKEAENQEPVAHQPWCASLTRMLLCMPPKPAPCDCKVQCMEHGECFGAKCIYTTPQQRTWVGLTNEESVEIQKISTCYEQAVELTEAKLRSKNHA